MEQAPRYSTLHDYLRVLRQRWKVIVGFTVVLGAAALAASLAQKPTYEASAQLAFRDIAADLDLVSGSPSAPDITAGTRAATNAELITRPAVTLRVAKMLNSKLTPAELAASIQTRVGVETNLVILTAQSEKAGQAAKIANAYAHVVKQVGTKRAKALLGKLEKRAADDLRNASARKNRDSFQLSALQDRLSRIRTLQDVTKPVEVVESAFKPVAPVSPKPARNTILGMLLGFIFGLLAAFIRDSLDRRVHTAHDAQQELGVSVLGRVGKDAFSHPGLAANGKDAMDEADFEVFRTLRTNLRSLMDGEGLSTILVTSGRPDEGKTTVSLALASAFAVTGQRVLLVECDLRRPTFAKRLKVAESPGLTDYVMGNAGPKDILQVVDLVEPTSSNGSRTLESEDPGRSFVCITAGSPVAMPAELLGGDTFKEFLAKVSKAYDTVVIDASPLLSVVDPLELVPLVSGVLMCVRAGQTTRDEARATKAALANLPERPTGVVLTGLKRGTADGYGYYYGY